MDWLNYHHLFYFWVVAREGSVTAAANRLLLSPSTVSTQLKQLEQNVGVPLFHREGRRLVLTVKGRQARAYCDEIFGLGQEMVAMLRKPVADEGRPVHLRVGVADILHKWVAHRVLGEGLRAAGPVHLSCHSDQHEPLVAELVLHNLDLVLTDTPAGLSGEPSVDTVRLASLPVVLLGRRELVEPRRGAGVGALDGAPVLLPAQGTALRRALEAWFDDRQIVPHVVGEFGDSSLMKAFARDGAGLLPVPRAVAAEVCAVYGVEELLPLEGVEERVYVVKPHRNQHPLLPELLEAGRRALLAPEA